MNTKLGVGDFAVQSSSIVAFIGPVGVGKSTQMRLLKHRLESKNVKVVCTFIKSNHVFSFFLSRFLIFLGSKEIGSYPGGLVIVYPRRAILRALFPLLCVLDAASIAIKFLFRVQIPFLFGSTVLVEEGLLMTLFTYEVFYPRFFNTRPRMLPFVPRLLGWTMARNHKNIVLDAEDEELRLRRKQRSQRQNELDEYVAEQRKWIGRLGFDHPAIINTTGKSVGAVHREILRTLDAQIPLELMV